MSRRRAEHEARPSAGRSGPPAGPRGASRRGALPRLLSILLLVLAAAPAARPAQARAVAGGVAPVLTPPVRDSLDLLQEGWLQWTTALYGADSERALEVIDDLVATSERLGMERLPDLSAGTLVQAVQAAREGELERARLALAAAERLDPGRPETAFAEAEVARASGDPLGRISAQVRGYLSALGAGTLRDVLLADLALWMLVSLVVSGGLFVALLMGTEGRSLVHHFGALFARRLPRTPQPLVQVLILLALLWPLVLPWGPVWLVLYWSVLLWRHAAVSQRTVLVCLWLLLGLTPWAADRIRTWLNLELSPPVRAMESVAEGRLYGGLFLDLSVMPTVLPDDPAVDQFLGDLHVRFGQWDEARRRYERVLDAEPENVDVLLNLGAYYFNRGDYANAVAMFQQVTATEPEHAAAHFNLSLAYAESYLFDEHREALLEARRLNDQQVTDWMDRPEHQRIVTVEGGSARSNEIREALARAWAPKTEAAPGLQVLKSIRSLLVVAIGVALGLALLAGLRRLGPAEGASPLPRAGNGREGGGAIRRLVPGLESSSLDRGFAAYCAVFVPAALLAALAAVVGQGFGYAVPWRYDPGDWLPLWTTVAALGLLVALRVGRALSNRG
ncbi:MAG: tetratricopeptide repeat protein [Acidobacteriota bacterium]|jgi:tetratricopeptide (TPR) repeat protein